MKIAKIYPVFLCVFIFGFISCSENKEHTVETSTHSKMDLDLLDLQAKNRLGKDTIVTIENDPVYHKAKRYKAVNALELVRNEIGLSKIDIKNTKIVFECIDGYQPEMPLEIFLNAKPFLAFEDISAAKGSNWEKIIKNGNEMDAAPFYLVYSDDSEKANDYKWPYNLIKIHLKPLNDSNKELFPVEDKNAELGYNLFKNQCITCHSLNGNGGKMGPELNFPKSVTEYWKEEELVAFIVDPSAFRHQVKMPTLAISKKESQEIVGYLKYMAKHKKKPTN